MKRRNFLIDSTKTLALIGAGAWGNSLEAKNNSVSVTILHTNDMHSRIEPFPSDNQKYAGRGGMAARATLVSQIRKSHSNVLLLDSGDIFQGTPYFNFFGGEPEFKLMSEMGYDAATLGNHDFDAGMDGFKKQLPHAQFPFLNCNYSFEDTPLHDSISPYKIFSFEEINIGVFGVGIELAGLVPKKLYGNTQYHNPIYVANQMAYRLKNELKCHYIICLSHLGYQYKTTKISDHTLAENTSNIDLILGGHTHTFLNEATILKSNNNKPCMISQSGWAGLMMSKTDITFCRKSRFFSTKFRQVKF